MLFIIDKALEKRQQEGNPIRVGMVGAGFMARGIALQLCQYVPGMKLVAISNRHLEGAKRAYTEAGIEDFVVSRNGWATGTEHCRQQIRSYRQCFVAL
jgi:predicted homoserine dehydrogenase-like protein